jgi:lambda repressor-like predicted transcriptional regulator
MPSALPYNACKRIDRSHMEFEWNPAKVAANLKKHGVSFSV